MNKSNDELIQDLKFVPCKFNRDVLFSIVLLDDHDQAETLKEENIAKNLTATEISKVYADSVHSWYYYSNQNAVLMMANNEWRDKK